MSIKNHLIVHRSNRYTSNSKVCQIYQTYLRKISCNTDSKTNEEQLSLLTNIRQKYITSIDYHFIFHNHVDKKSLVSFSHLKTATRIKLNFSNQKNTTLVVISKANAFTRKVLDSLKKITFVEIEYLDDFGLTNNVKKTTKLLGLARLLQQVQIKISFSEQLLAEYYIKHLQHLLIRNTWTNFYQNGLVLDLTMPILASDTKDDSILPITNILENIEDLDCSNMLKLILNLDFRANLPEKIMGKFTKALGNSRCLYKLFLQNNMNLGYSEILHALKDKKIFQTFIMHITPMSEREANRTFDEMAQLSELEALRSLEIKFINITISSRLREFFLSIGSLQQLTCLNLCLDFGARLDVNIMDLLSVSLGELTELKTLSLKFANSIVIEKEISSGVSKMFQAIKEMKSLEELVVRVTDSSRSIDDSTFEIFCDSLKELNGLKVLDFYCSYYQLSKFMLDHLASAISGMKSVEAVSIRFGLRGDFNSSSVLDIVSSLRDKKQLTNLTLEIPCAVNDKELFEMQLIFREMWSLRHLTLKFYLGAVLGRDVPKLWGSFKKELSKKVYLMATAGITN